MNASLPRRGRPKAIPENEIDEIRKWFPGIKTRRGIQNKCYEIRAIGLFYRTLGDQERFRHIIPPEADAWSGIAEFPFAILRELGRMDEGEAVEAADRICAKRMDPAESVRFLRSLRTGGRSRNASRLSLLAKLENALNTYTAAHDCDADFVLSVVEDFSEIVSETREASE
ncbi:hypothetical protein [Rosistilla oblonga]|uniref:hypothetical protein n=1 Tax=Rosistilla oblonga TaxID=2527990 RepID=UPI003A986F91